VDTCGKVLLSGSFAAWVLQGKWALYTYDSPHFGKSVAVRSSKMLMTLISLFDPTRVKNSFGPKSLHHSPTAHLIPDHPVLWHTHKWRIAWLYLLVGWLPVSICTHTSISPQPMCKKVCKISLPWESKSFNSLFSTLFTSVHNLTTALRVQQAQRQLLG